MEKQPNRPQDAKKAQTTDQVLPEKWEGPGLAIPEGAFVTESPYRGLDFIPTIEDDPEEDEDTDELDADWLAHQRSVASEPYPVFAFESTFPPRFRRATARLFVAAPEMWKTLRLLRAFLGEAASESAGITLTQPKLLQLVTHIDKVLHKAEKGDRSNAFKCADRGLSTRGIAWLDCDSPEGAKYIEMQQYAIAYASRNRWAIMDTIAWHLKSEACMEVETIHNYIGVDGVIRKGAVSAKKDERLVIPFNMRDGIAICVGKGNPDWNNSAPHGAGRILSRSQAKRQLDVDEFRATMQAAGVYTTSADETTLDEAPGAYKDKDVILACIKDTVEVIGFIKPVYNFKAGNERRDRKRKTADD